jgi:NAD(P)-dependent dehydrogenase (short-subunit alcohol dehydrogenase family)
MSKSLFSLEGRVAVVVGGTSGIGRVLALGLLTRADVVAQPPGDARDESRLRSRRRRRCASPPMRSTPLAYRGFRQDSRDVGKSMPVLRGINMGGDDRYD